MGVPIALGYKEDDASGAQVIDGSLKFDSSKNQYLSRTPGSAGNRQTWTWSGWVKRSTLGAQQALFNAGITGSQQISGISFTSNSGVYDKLELWSGIQAVNTEAWCQSLAFYRDASAWYHIVIAVDTTQSTAADRVKFYVNNSILPVAAYSSYSTYPSQNYSYAFNNTVAHQIGKDTVGTPSYYNGSITNIYFIDGQQLDASYFGYTDPLTNTWRPKKLSSSVAFGTNGFYLPFDGNSPIGQDQSGRGNNWTPVNFGGSNTLEKATGALPILNTDGGGKVARVGVRTDAFASNLVLATPLVGIASDFSNKINSGTTEKVMTVSGATANTAGNFYGGSYKFVAASSQQITTPGSSDFAFGTGDFCVECWYYNDTSGGGTTYNQLVGNIESSTAGFWRIGSVFAGGNQFWFTYTNGNYNDVFTNININDGKWHHLAATRESGTLRLFVDGVVQATATVTQNFSQTTTLRMMYSAQQPGYANGYLQDVRIYKGTAKYTQNFIPASTDPDILPDTPSGVAYSSNVALIPSTDGGGVTFDGNGDYLSLSASADFGFSTPSGNANDFTIEWFQCWTSLTYYQTIWSNNYTSTPGILVQTGNGDGKYRVFVSNGTELFQETNAPAVGVWYHYALVRNGTTYTIYRNGVANGSATSSNAAGSGSDTATIGQGNGTYYLNAIVSNFHVVKGTALYTANFTPPTGPISSVANTKLLCCKSQTSATVYDVSPGTITANGNATATNFNPFTVNINTQRGQESGYATLNPLTSSAVTSNFTFSNGNLNVNGSNANQNPVVSTVFQSTGKWYWEVQITSGTGGRLGIVNPLGYNEGLGGGTNGWCFLQDGRLYYNSSATSYGFGVNVGETMMFALDVDAGKVWYGANGIWMGGGVPYTGSNASQTFTANQSMSPALATGDATNFAANFGQKPFKFPPPAGFQPLALANTPRPTIVRPDQYMGIVTWTGSVATASASPGVNEPPVRTGWNFKPDFLWIKDRNQAWSIGHRLYDSVRGLGVNKHLNTEETSAEGSGNDETYGYVTGFVNGGFTSANGTSGNDYVNSSVTNYVGWAWKAGGSGGGLSFWKDDVGYSTASAAGLTAGTITPTGASVNTKSGFSIITYTGTNANATISHGLGNVPAFIIAKSRDTSSWNWIVYHKDIGVSDYLALESTQGSDTRFANIWGTGHTTSVFGVRTGYSNNPNGEQMVAYCWAEIPGFSKFGKYTGNASTDGPMIITGFRPRWIIVKRYDTTGNWVIVDTARDPYNYINSALYADFAYTESSVGAGPYCDCLSNGFKVRTSAYTNWNASGGTYIYAAFAESPSFNLYGGQANAR